MLSEHTSGIWLLGNPDDAADRAIAAAHDMSPGSMGISFCCRGASEIRLRIEAATYEAVDLEALVEHLRARRLDAGREASARALFDGLDIAPFGSDEVASGTNLASEYRSDRPCIGGLSRRCRARIHLALRRGGTNARDIAILLEPAARPRARRHRLPWLLSSTMTCRRAIFCCGSSARIVIQNAPFAAQGAERPDHPLVHLQRPGDRPRWTLREGVLRAGLLLEGLHRADERR